MQVQLKRDVVTGPNVSQEDPNKEETQLTLALVWTHKEGQKCLILQNE